MLQIIIMIVLYSNDSWFECNNYFEILLVKFD